MSLLRGPQVGELKLNEDGSFTNKKPKKQFERHTFNGVAFIYEVSDSAGNTAQARVTINKE